MIVAIPIVDKSVDSPLDTRFGRCSFFGFYNRKTKVLKYQENRLMNEPECAGIKVAEFLFENGINKIYTVRIGAKSKKILNRLNIAITRQYAGTTIGQLINNLNQ